MVTSASILHSLWSARCAVGEEDAMTMLVDPLKLTDGPAVGTASLPSWLDARRSAPTS